MTFDRTGYSDFGTPPSATPITTPMRSGWVYIMSNRPNGTLYVGVTADLAHRVYRHRTGDGSSFVRKYGLTRLVYAEAHPEITTRSTGRSTSKHAPAPGRCG